MAAALKLGKRPATHSPKDLLFENYAEATALPEVPVSFGHEDVIGESWGMLGNDAYGDCVWAGGDHETMLWLAEAGQPVAFADDNALSDYAAVTGFRKDDPSTDQGTDVRQALNYRRKTGLIDASGRRHKIGAYVALEPGNVEHLLQALYLFSAVGIGFEFPTSAMAQFNAGKPWSIQHGAQIDGGHYVPLVARRHHRLRCVTWSKVQEMTMAFFAKYCDEAYAILSPEMLKGGKSLEGFDLTQLKADLTAVTA